MTTPEKPYLPALEQAIAAAGNMSKLAERLGLTFQHIQQWRKAGRVPAEWARKVEAAVESKVTRYELRPDVFGERGGKVPA
jgi:DNA-binding transcriptional regulator YdaS (Cro superfamily)